MKQKKPAKLDRPRVVHRRSKPGSYRPRALPWKRILVPLDFSGKSRQALDAAISLAERRGGKILLIHVVEPAYFAGEMGLTYLPIDTAQVVDKAKVHLREMAVQLIPPELLGAGVVRRGTAYVEITAAARSLKADLIIIASRGHTGLSRVLLGSTAERVVRHAPCPVLVVRRPP